MEKMTEDEFHEGLSLFMSILEKQPNLISARQAGDDPGAAVARMAGAFIKQFQQQKKQIVQD